ncbi:MAG TPA: hypothetical protein VE466_04390, partial [Acidimicrobiales bacterium]|nr:hypothetical protein [Acidimicrobiales bacterium]
VFVDANDCAGRVVPGGEAGGGVASPQAAKRIPPTTAPSSAAVGARTRRRCRARIAMSSSGCSG